MHPGPVSDPEPAPTKGEPGPADIAAAVEHLRRAFGLTDREQATIVVEIPDGGGPGRLGRPQATAKLTHRGGRDLSLEVES